MYKDTRCRSLYRVVQDEIITTAAVLLNRTYENRSAFDKATRKSTVQWHLLGLIAAQFIATPCKHTSQDYWRYTNAFVIFITIINKTSVLWRYWLGAGVVICLEQGADLHMAQLMPLPLTVSCFNKIQIGFTFQVPAHLGSPGKGR